jgi:GNAT superfamily N-acetyltransferase
METHSVPCTGIRFSVTRDGEEVGHAYLYLLVNDLHAKPLGFLEDVHVTPEYRGRGVARELLEHVTARARTECYKLIATSRNDGTRDDVHAWYVRLGFRTYGTEFRVDF